MNAVEGLLRFLPKLLCWLFAFKNKIKVDAVVMPKKSLKTYIKNNKLNSVSKAVFLDIEDTVLTKYKLKSIDDELFIMKAKEYLEEVKKSVRHRIIILTSKRGIARELGVSKKRIHHFIPSHMMFKDLIKDITNDDMLDEIKKSRDTVIHNAKGAVEVFNSIDELVTLFLKKFKLSMPDFS